ncbi:MAG: ABC transporter ATP-binding protein [Rhizobiales bacterium]|nr:ABC transporter ATP-binding protein [Hyphomicrobiales bacterium]
MSPSSLGEGGSAALSLRNLVKRYGKVTATDSVSLDVEAGEFVSLLGPSGSGKTTLLMLLAGFETADSGEIRLHGRDISRVPPNKRDIGMVFQRYALFPHMTVAQNVAFPLRMRGVAKAEQERRVKAALDMVELREHLDRVPAQLSGGQQQRVALARAIVFEPGILLMDEPLGALDKKLRKHMQVELTELQHRLKATVIYVTHDQEEALAMSSRVAIINEGRIEQLSTPRDLYDRPASPFVGDFIGDINLFDAKVEEMQSGACAVATPFGRLLGTPVGPAALAPGAAVRVGVRPERLSVDERPTGGVAPAHPATIRHTIFNGNNVAVHMTMADGQELWATVSPNDPEANLPRGATVHVSAAPQDVFVFPAGAA